MSSNTCEVIVNGKTYTTVKPNPLLMAKYRKAALAAARECENLGGLSFEQLQQLGKDAPQADPLGASIYFTCLSEAVLPIMWDFLPPTDKTAIGTREAFLDGLEYESLNAFIVFMGEKMEQANRFLAGTPAKGEEPEAIPSTTSTPSLPEVMDGPSESVSP